ncbi:hypothetical protein LCGC14_0971470 [marine sediment metagenome]|uniref:Uncharacterized protein n=1 Tax=marine sediment metagenome TaxID=412755 RepID=A0A0F9NBL7_9ZZZZ
MSEGRLSIKLMTEERFRAAETDYLKRAGVEKIGDRDILTVEETEDGIQICRGTDSRWYFNPGKIETKSPEKQKSGRSCVILPKEFIPEVKALVDEYLTKRRF